MCLFNFQQLTIKLLALLTLIKLMQLSPNFLHPGAALRRLFLQLGAPGLGFPLAGGGRYDHLLSDFGSACPATGFAIGIERILLALTRQGLEKPDQPKDIYLGYAPGREHDAIQKAQELRAGGKVVELALLCQTEDDARAMQQTKGYASLVYLA